MNEIKYVRRLANSKRLFQIISLKTNRRGGHTVGSEYVLHRPVTQSYVLHDYCQTELSRGPHATGPLARASVASRLMACTILFLCGFRQSTAIEITTYKTTVPLYLMQITSNTTSVVEYTACRYFTK
jgi:hypothetical protein